jgi:NTP pyrophosphatase (non-canonical NTP hydrolase)
MSIEKDWSDGLTEDQMRELINRNNHFSIPNRGWELQKQEPSIELITDAQRLQDLMNNHEAWEEATFENPTVLGNLNHLAEEVKEAIAAVEIEVFPDATKEEFADCFLLLVGAARKYGLTASDLLHEAEKKLEKVKLRKYGKADANGVSHHIKETTTKTLKKKK